VNCDSSNLRALIRQHVLSVSDKLDERRNKFSDWLLPLASECVKEFVVVRSGVRESSGRGEVRPSTYVYPHGHIVDHLLLRAVRDCGHLGKR
jgi:hypothetical protein